ncbi:MAG: sugar ABC transporter ATP-binding protein [Verrucomicrobiota bacterium]
MEELLQVKGVSKTFPGVKALSDVDFSVRAGEVHALMGENGAGKSTLIKVLTGVHARDGGVIRFGGEEISVSAPVEAEKLGISTVFQEVNLIPHLSVAENIVLGRQEKKFGLIDWKAAKGRARKALARLGLNVEVSKELCECSVAIQQMVAIARAIDLDARLLILDEPTASLDEQEVDELFQVLERLRSEGMGIVFVTHFLDQVYRITDRITVLRNGALVGVSETKKLPRLELIGQMLGRTSEEVKQLEESQVSAEEGEQPEAFFEAQELGRRGAIAPFDFEIGEGETVGLVGLLGSGRTESVRLMFGVDQATSGELKLDGQSLQQGQPKAAIAGGLAFCPEDRKVEGLVLNLSVRENIVLALQARQGIFKMLSRSEQNELADHYIEALKIKTPGRETRVGTLSGGNQQKVLLARWLAMKPRLMIVDEPTRGIDVGAKGEIENLMESLREEGMAIVFISSEMEEVVRVCQRVMVLRDREVVGSLAGREVTEDAVIELIAKHD